MTKAEQDKYCRNGDPEGMHLASYNEKTKQRKFLSINDDEWQAMLNKSRSFAEGVNSVKF